MSALHTVAMSADNYVIASDLSVLREIKPRLSVETFRSADSDTASSCVEETIAEKLLRGEVLCPEALLNPEDFMPLEEDDEEELDEEIREYVQSFQAEVEESYRAKKIVTRKVDTEFLQAMERREVDATKNNTSAARKRPAVDAAPAAPAPPAASKPSFVRRAAAKQVESCAEASLKEQFEQLAGSPARALRRAVAVTREAGEQ